MTSLDRALDEDELIEAAAAVHLLGIRSKTQVTERVLAAAPQLLAVGAFCIGTNQIDLLGATEHGVTVFNAPFSNTRSVVELVIAELIALTRRLTEKNALMHEGVWDKSATGAHEVRGRTLGIVGYGNIGTQLSVLAENLGMRVLFYDTADRLALGNAQRCESLKQLLHDADVVTLHVDGRPENRNIFGDAEFAAMRAGSLFLNLSRGFVVDYAALRSHIDPGTSLAPRWTSSRSSRRAGATSSSPSCEACRTSSSPRTSAAPPRRPSRTSGSSWRTSSSTSSPRDPPPCR